MVLKGLFLNERTTSCSNENNLRQCWNQFPKVCKSQFSDLQLRNVGNITQFLNKDIGEMGECISEALETH